MAESTSTGGKRKQRGTNFTEAEKYYLLRITKGYKDEVENKKTDLISVKKKLKVWEEIAERYNRNCQTGTRSVKQLRALYDKNKQKYEHDPLDVSKTGTDILPRIIEIIEEKIIDDLKPEIVPLTNPYDSNSENEVYENTVILEFEDSRHSHMFLEEASSCGPLDNISVVTADETHETNNIETHETNNIETHETDNTETQETNIIETLETNNIETLETNNIQQSASHENSVNYPASNCGSVRRKRKNQRSDTTECSKDIVNEKKCQVLDVELELKRKSLEILSVELEIKKAELQIKLKELSKM